MGGGALGFDENQMGDITSESLETNGLHEDIFHRLFQSNLRTRSKSFINIRTKNQPN
jgi:hypothetical protein